MKYTLTLERHDICRILTALTEVACTLEEEMHDENCDSYRKEKVLPPSIAMWKQIHDDVEAQLDEHDKKQDWYKELKSE